MYLTTNDWEALAESVRPSARREMHIERLDGEAVLFDRDGARSLKLNATALEVWDRCDGDHSVYQIAENLAERFEVDPAIAVDDVEQLVLSFRESGLLEREDIG